MDKTVNDCRRKGFVVTPFGRRIFIPFINDKIVVGEILQNALLSMRQFKVGCRFN